MKSSQPEESDGYSITTWERAADDQEARWRDEKREASRIKAIFKSAKPGDNELGNADFLGLVTFAFPRDEMPKQHKVALSTGRLEWTGGIVFVRKP